MGRSFRLIHLSRSMAAAESAAPVPQRIVVHRRSRRLELDYGEGRNVSLPFEFLRVYSPSAEVRGHGPGQETLQTGKADVGIESLEAVGQYAVQPRFTDGHATGIYSWDYLWRLGHDQDRMWAEYLERLKAAGASRQAPAGSGPGGQAVKASSGSPSPVLGRTATRPR